MKRSILIMVVLIASLPAATSQVPNYILQRKTFNPGISSISVSPDGKLLLAGFVDGSFQVLDPENFQSILEVKEAHTKAVTALDMPPKMDLILTAGANYIKTWGRDGELIDAFNGHATSIWNAEISSDGKYAVSTAFNKTFLLWDLYEGSIADHMRGHEDVTLTACFSKNNKMIASGSNDNTIKIWDLESRELIQTFYGPTEDIYDVAFGPNSDLVAAASAEKSIRIYSMEENKLVHILKGHRAVVRKVDFSPNGAFLVSASEDNALILWDVRGGEKIHPFTENDGAILDVKFHPDGSSFYSISSEGELTRWEMNHEIFVLRYYEAPYKKELSSDPIFEARRKGEPKKEYQSRQAEAEKLKAGILQGYYQLYLEEHTKMGTAQ